MIKDDFADLFGSDYRNAPPSVKTVEQLKADTGKAINSFNNRIANAKTKCKVCSSGVDALYTVKYGNGRSFQFAKPCGHKQ